MTLRTASLLTSSLAVTLALAGCNRVEDTNRSDAGDLFADAFTVDLDASSTDDAFGVGPPIITFDAFSADDAFTSSDDTGPIVGDSFIADTCGPADGAALQLTISDALDVSSCTADPEMASTLFYIHDLGGADLPPTPGATITSTTAESNGTATQCPGGSPPCRLSETWSITFTSYDADGGASGQYNITWEGGETSTGTFQATRCESGPVICG